MGSKQAYNITVKNTFQEIGSNIKVYHHSASLEDTIENGKEKPFALKPTSPQDYLHVSVTHSTNELSTCWVGLDKGKAELEFIPEKKIGVKMFNLSGITILEIPGNSGWKLKVIVPKASGPGGYESQNVTIGDDKPGIED